jgi:PIN domain nuclease of toxin-antitoxin system
MGRRSVLILLDTHTLIWWAEDENKLGKQAQEAITDARAIGVHVISCLEIAILIEKDKIELTLPVEEWVGRVMRHPKVEVIPLSIKGTIECTRLPGEFHRDPFDQILAAACLLNGWPLVTKDQAISEWSYIETIWK